MSSSSSMSPMSSSTRDSTMNTGASLVQSSSYRRSVKINGDIILVSESSRSRPNGDPIVSKYESQMRSAMQYQVAAGNAGAPHLRAHGSRSAAASGSDHVIRRVPQNRIRPLVIQERAQAVSRPLPTPPLTPERQTGDTSSLPTPPPTPTISRLPSPMLPSLEPKGFCGCKACKDS
ncbi:MAG: hypothetical protein M1820_004473 [Bogoriella megaspora]|nr:MAG: hypothetical protein M1820_004473 [Bogoriella megaspora]